VISFPEFLEKWRGKNMAKSEIQEVFRVADANADG
jgi:Ca2+-binding EF-hand superfamily protein